MKMRFLLKTNFSHKNTTKCKVDLYIDNLRPGTTHDLPTVMLWNLFNACFSELTSQGIRKLLALCVPDPFPMFQLENSTFCPWSVT